LRINPLLFLLLVATGKLARYCVVAWLTLRMTG
jgi:membrane protein YqaA with SNARE-associated domain